MLVFLAVAIILGSDPVRGQPAYECTAGMSVLEPHATACDMFWECNNAVWLEQSCPLGTEYITGEPCAVDTNGDCQPSSQNTIPAQCVGADSHFAYDLNLCSSFFREVDGSVREYRCVAGMVFNSLANVCDWPENYPQCNVPSESATLNATDQSAMTCPADTDDVHPVVVSSVVSCGEYYVCLNGTLYVGNCSYMGNGAFPVFDANTKSCTALRETINIYCTGTA